MESERRFCLICGRELKQDNYIRKYCGEECKRIANKKRQKERYRKEHPVVKKPGRRKKEEIKAEMDPVYRRETLAEVNEKARKKGMTYGKYVGIQYCKERDRRWKYAKNRRRRSN